MEYRYQPQQKNKNALLLLFALTALAALALAIGMSKLLPYASIWQMGFLVFAVAAIYVLLRYFCTHYIYVITEEWGEPTLVVYHAQGRRLSTHCRLALSNLLRVVEVDDPAGEEGKRALAEFSGEHARYSYLTSLGNVPTQLIYGREGGVRFVIRIEADAAFMQVLNEAVERAVAYAAAHPQAEEDADDEE